MSEARLMTVHLSYHEDEDGDCEVLAVVIEDALKPLVSAGKVSIADILDQPEPIVTLEPAT